MTTADLRLGRWQDVLQGVEPHSIIADPPYGARTHGGYRSAQDGDEGSIARKTGLISYDALTRHVVRDFVRWATAIESLRWVVLFGDDVTSQWWKNTLSRAGWYTFAPLAVIKEGATPRFSGDGPASAVEWVTTATRCEEDVMQLVIARRTGIKDGARKGWYRVGRVEVATNGSLLVGQKPLALMQSIVRDYSRPGDLVCDPFCGSGTTAIAALQEGRRFVGSEAKPEHHAIAMRRIAKGYTPTMF